MLLSFSHGSGIVIMTALGSGIPLIIRNSNVLSSIAESEPEELITGSTLCISPFRTPEDIVSSRANMVSALPRIVLISPLWTIKRFGCARIQLGFVFVLKRECTVAMADS